MRSVVFLFVSLLESCNFISKIEIYDLSCEGAVIGAKRSTIVTIANDELFNETLDNIMDLTHANLNDLKLYQSSWMEQMKVFMTTFSLSGSYPANSRKRSKLMEEIWRRRVSWTT